MLEKTVVTDNADCAHNIREVCSVFHGIKTRAVSETETVLSSSASCRVCRMLFFSYTAA